MNSFKCASDLEVNHEEWLIEDTIPRDGITVICGKDGFNNSLVATELALRLAYGTHLRDRDTPSAEQVLYVTVDSKNKMAKRIKCWKEAYPVSGQSLFSIIDGPVDFLNEADLQHLVTDIAYYNKCNGNNEYPALVVVEIQGGLTDEFLSNELINSIDYLRSQMGSAFLLVFNEGSCEGSCEEGNVYRKIFNAADTVHRVTATNLHLRMRLSCIKMKNFAKPSFVMLDICCVDYQETKGVSNDV